MANHAGKSEPTCTYCGGFIEQGWLLDASDSPKAIQWIRGAVKRGVFGGTKSYFEDKYESQAYRCVRCGHLELFVPHAG